MTSLPNWFAKDGQKNFENIVLPDFGGEDIRALQIGAYTGDASVWMYNNLLKDTDSVLVDVDTWEGSDEVAHHALDWGTVESVYDAKILVARNEKKIIKVKLTSDHFFKNNKEKFDFIYIDGDHTAYGVLKDAVNAYECLKPWGILAFDDYQWSGGDGPEDRPGMAIDAFLGIYKNKIEVIIKDYQCWVTKVG
jgi:predicted O-methyltransferase YrrM